MELADSLTITALGLAVVFSGLLLTALLIVALGQLQNLSARLRAPQGQRPSNATGAGTTPPVDPEVVTVIATVLEVERRLYRSEQGQRLTIARKATNRPV